MSNENQGSLRGIIERLTDGQEKLLVAVTEIQTELRLRPSCPRPGLCEQLDARVKTIEDDKIEVKAYAHVAKWVIGTVGGLIGAIGGIAAEHFWKK